MGVVKLKRLATSPLLFLPGVDIILVPTDGQTQAGIYPAAQIKKGMEYPAAISGLYQASMPFYRSNAAFLPKIRKQLTCVVQHAA